MSYAIFWMRLTRGWVGEPHRPTCSSPGELQPEFQSGFTRFCPMEAHKDRAIVASIFWVGRVRAGTVERHNDRGKIVVSCGRGSCQQVVLGERPGHRRYMVAL